MKKYSGLRAIAKAGNMADARIMAADYQAANPDQRYGALESLEVHTWYVVKATGREFGPGATAVEWAEGER